MKGLVEPSGILTCPSSASLSRKAGSPPPDPSISAGTQSSVNPYVSRTAVNWCCSPSGLSSEARGRAVPADDEGELRRSGGGKAVGGGVNLMVSRAMDDPAPAEVDG